VLLLFREKLFDSCKQAVIWNFDEPALSISELARVGFLFAAITKI